MYRVICNGRLWRSFNNLFLFNLRLLLHLPLFYQLLVNSLRSQLSQFPSNLFLKPNLLPSNLF